MSSLQIRKAILRSRAVEFTRLMMLSMLENANDTFSAMLTLLGSELGQSNLSTDQFLQTFSELIDELRLKINSREDGDLAGNSKDTFNTSKSNGTIVLDGNFDELQESNITQRLNEIGSKQTSHASSSTYNKTMAGNQCNVCKNTVPSDQKFYFSLGICQNCYSKGSKNRQELDKPISIGGQYLLERCNKCRRAGTDSSLSSFNRNCVSCYYKTQHLRHQKQPQESGITLSTSSSLGDRQCSECKKIVSRGKVFYRSAHLCKNCYERNRVLIRKSRKHCSECNHLSNEELLDGKCVQCHYKQGHNDVTNETNQFNEHQIEEDSLNSTDKINSWINSIEDSEQNAVINEDVEMLLNLCQSDILHCSTCKKSVGQEDLSKNGVCGSCSVMAIKDESPE